MNKRKRMNGGIMVLLAERYGTAEEQPECLQENSKMEGNGNCFLFFYLSFLDSFTINLGGLGAKPPNAII